MLDRRENQAKGESAKSAKALKAFEGEHCKGKM